MRLSPARLRAYVGQQPNRAKECAYVEKAKGRRLWGKIQPGYRGGVGKKVKDLGVSVKGPGQASVKRGKRFRKAGEVVSKIGRLPFASRGQTNWGLQEKR